MMTASVGLFAIFENTGELLDPHSAIGVDVARQCRGDNAVPIVSLATAHSGCFPMR